MNAAFPFQERKEYPSEQLAAMLAFDSLRELTEFCNLFNVTVDHRGVRLGERAGKQLVFREPEHKLRRSGPNLRVVGAKLHSSLMHVINTPLDQQMLAPAQLSTSARSAQSSITGIQPAVSLPAPLPSLQSRLSAQNTAMPAGPSTNSSTSGPSFAAAASSSDISAAASRFGFSQNAAQPLKIKSNSQPAAIFAPGMQMQAEQDSLSPFSASPSGAKKPAKSVSFAPTLVADASGPGFTFPAKSQPNGSLIVSNSALAASANSDAAGAGSTSLSAAKSPAKSFAVSPAKVSAEPTNQHPDKTVFSTPEPKQQQEILQQQAVQAVQGSPAADIVWNRPRMRINWTSLTNALYANLIDSLVSEVGQPIVQRARKHSKAALALSEDIAEAIVSYTSAFMVYEESYRCLLFAQADSFRRRSVIGRAFSRWSMESVAKQQDRALQQQYIDELDRMVDSEYIGQKQMFSSISKNSPMLRKSDIVCDLDNISPCAPIPSISASLPSDFWESLHLGQGNFDAVCHILKRYGSPSLESLVELYGAQDMSSVLSSWLWWQIDPSTVSASSQSARSAKYSRAYRQRKVATLQRIEVREAVDSEYEDISTRRVSAMIVLLSSEPVTGADIRGDLANTPLGAHIRKLVSGSLNKIRQQAPLQNANESIIPVLNVFWCSDSRAAKAVRRFVEYIVSIDGVPSNVSMHTLALNVTMAKSQFAAGVKWLFQKIAHSRRNLLIRVSRAYDPVVDSMLRMLCRLRSCVC
ncbi:hypothetical protein FB639_003816, partial [Coemansia asiatica]